MSNQKEAPLTTGPVWRALASMSAPMSFGILAVLSVGLADAYFLSQVSGAALAAVGFIYPVTTAVTSLSIGLSAGANTALSQGVGRGDDSESARRLALHAVTLATLLAAMAGVILWTIYPVLFAALGASNAAAQEIAGYMPVWSVSFPFLVTMMVINAVFRAHGDSLTAPVVMVIAATINLALDPLLIFGLWGLPELGTQGAAVATLAGRASAMLIAVWLAWRRGLLGVCGKPFDGFVGSVRAVLSVGLPAAFSNAINPAGMALITAAVATIGEAAVAGFGAATRVQSLALVPLMALSAGIGPVVGQNWGAKREDRAQQGTSTAFWFCAAYGALMALVLGVFARPIADLFTSGSEDTGYAALYLRFVGASLFGYGIVVVANAAMNARDKAVWSMALSLSRIFLIYLPLAWAGAMTAGFPGIVAAAVLANVLGAWGGLVTTRANGLISTKTFLVNAPRRLLPGQS